MKTRMKPFRMWVQARDVKLEISAVRLTSRVKRPPTHLKYIAAARGGFLDDDGAEVINETTHIAEPVDGGERRVTGFCFGVYKVIDGLANHVEDFDVLSSALAYIDKMYGATVPMRAIKSAIYLYRPRNLKPMEYHI